MRNDIRVDVFGEIGTNGKAAWAGVLTVVWYCGNTGEVRKPEADGNQGPAHVRGAGQRSYTGGRRESPRQENSFGVYRTIAGVKSEQIVEGLKSAAAQEIRLLHFCLRS